MIKLKQILERLLEKQVITSMELRTDKSDENNVLEYYTCNLHKDYYKEYDYIKRKFLEEGYTFNKFDLSLNCVIMPKEDNGRLKIIDDCFFSKESILKYVDYNKHLTSYHSVGNLIYANQYGVWDLTTEDGRLAVLTELRNLERVSLDLFTLSTVLLGHTLSEEEYYDVINYIYSNLDESNHNVLPKETEEDKEYMREE